MISKATLIAAFLLRVAMSLVTIDLKIEKFKPKYVDKMNYYFSLLDRLERRVGENRSIDIILYAKKEYVAEELT